MKKLMSIVLLAALSITVLTGCGSEKFEVREIKPYFYEVGTYTSLNYDFVNDYFRKNNDNWGGGCSAVSAVINGTRLVGRNMDLNISNKCAYFVKTDVPGKYETIGLAYTFRDMSPDYEVMKAKGLGEDFEKLLPFMCDDVLNSEGLFIEINMRHGEQDAEGNDLFSVEHTNADAAERIYVFTLGQHIALNCKNLEEVKKYIAESVDIYTEKNYWSYCFIVSDAAGNAALLEFGNGRYYWIEPDENGVVAQTNFYVNEECYEMENMKTGLGRYSSLMDGIGNVSNKAELYELMKKVSFSWYYSGYEECMNNHFDPRSEVIGEENEYGIDVTYEFVMDPENAEFLTYAIGLAGEYVRSMSRQELQNENCHWESTFTEVVDPKEKTIEVRLFENEDYLYQLSFDGIKEISEIK